jgi:HK97 family phage prohead protease
MKLSRKEFVVEWKAVKDQPRMIKGYGSTFGPPADHGGDIIEKGAFTKTIASRVKQGVVPLLDSHIYDSAHTLGTVVDASEDDYGLMFTASLADVPSVEEIRQKMLQGHLKKTSIGYNTVRQSYSEDKATGETYRHLLEVDLYEISVVPLPMNERAVITTVKDMIDGESSLEDIIALLGQLDDEELASLMDALSTEQDLRTSKAMKFASKSERERLERRARLLSLI